MNDREIVNLYWQRSEQAIDETAQKYGRYCHIIAYNILENVEDSEECVNDTWMSAWNAMPDKRPDRLGPFLARITRNFALTKIVRRTARKRGGGEGEQQLLRPHQHRNHGSEEGQRNGVPEAVLRGGNQGAMNND